MALADEISTDKVPAISEALSKMSGDQIGANPISMALTFDALAVLSSASVSSISICVERLRYLSWPAVCRRSGKRTTALSRPVSLLSRTHPPSCGP